jgi:hypothetical protein
MRTKRTSTSLRPAQKRLDGLKAVDPICDLGGGVSVLSFEGAIAKLAESLSSYNQTLAIVDDLLNQVESAERAVDELYSRVLAGVAVRFGRDSIEYEKVGGVRKSDRKKPRKVNSAA